MNAKILFIGLDVDDKNFHGYAMLEGETEGTPFKTKAQLADLIKAIELVNPQKFTVHACYESTYSGFHLCRGLQKAGIECTVIAAGLIPELSNDRVKNDRLDAEKLCRFFAKGLLTPVHLPDEEDEFNRMLLRSRSFLSEELKEVKRHIISVCKQLGWAFRADRDSASYWTALHREWLGVKLKTAPPAVQRNLSILISHFDSLQTRLDEYAVEIREIAEQPRYAEKKRALIGYRGIQTLTAMTFILEIGDPKRFPHPSKLISYAGLDISEYSSGGKAKRFGITKMGNRHIRRALVEAAQSASKNPNPSKEIRKRREGIDVKYVEVADRCMKRLSTKSRRLLLRGKPVNKIKVACARELLCFVWESLNLAS